MEEQERLAIEWACEKLCRQFANFGDKDDFKAVCELFTEDGIYCRPSVPDVEIVGRLTLYEAFLKRPPLVIRHIVSNCVIEVLSSTEARGFSYMQYLAAPKNDESLPKEAGPFNIGEFEDRYLLTNKGWKFKERKGRLSLTR